jgi:hypothetical protein
MFVRRGRSTTHSASENLHWDPLPDVAVGRWPVHDSVQLKAVATQTIEYGPPTLARLLVPNRSPR